MIRRRLGFQRGRASNVARERDEDAWYDALLAAERELSDLHPSTRRQLKNLVVSIVECGDLDIAAVLIRRWARARGLKIGREKQS